MYAPLQSLQNNWGSYGEKDSFNIFELSTNKDGGEMLKHLDLGDQSPVEAREAQSVNGPLRFFITVAYKYNLNRNPGFGCDNKGTKDISGTGKINEFFQPRKRILSAIIGITLL